MVDRVPYDEFSMFHENAGEFGLPTTARRPSGGSSVEVDAGRWLSALVWGDGPPELVLLHGGAQNAHTWDTVAMALERPLVAIDLPGHGHSDGGRDGSPRPAVNAEDVAVAIRALAPNAPPCRHVARWHHHPRAGGRRPELVRSIVLVDVTPGVDEREGARRSRAFIDGPERLPQLRRHPRPHHRVQPDAHGVVAAPRDPAQRDAARGR